MTKQIISKSDSTKDPNRYDELAAALVATPQVQIANRLTPYIAKVSDCLTSHQ